MEIFTYYILFKKKKYKMQNKLENWIYVGFAWLVVVDDGIF
jgi:hypothetical protein